VNPLAKILVALLHRDRRHCRVFDRDAVVKECPRFQDDSRTELVGLGFGIFWPSPWTPEDLTLALYVGKLWQWLCTVTTVHSAAYSLL